MSKTTEPAEAAASQKEAPPKSNNAPHEFVHRYETPPGPTASLSVTFSVDGFQFTFQGNTFEVGEGVGLLGTVPAMVKKLQGLEAEPALPPVAASSGNGSEETEAKIKLCPIHSMPMKQFEKDGRKWWSHKAYREDGSEYWCNGKEKKG